MNLYLDASALIKRYLSEEGSAHVYEAMKRADGLSCCRLGFVETLRTVEADGTAPMVRQARRDWSTFAVTEIDQPLCEEAVKLACRRGLRSLDAVHLAAALTLPHEDLLFATWDQRLHAAAATEGLQTLPASLP